MTHDTEMGRDVKRTARAALVVIAIVLQVLLVSVRAEATVRLREFRLPPGSQPIGIVIGNDGNAWFTEFGTSKVGRLAPNGDIAHFPLPEFKGTPTAIVSSRSGTLWFTDSGRVSRIGRSSLRGAIKMVDSPDVEGRPLGIAIAPDQTVWFVDGAAIYHMVALGHIKIYTIPATDVTSDGRPLGVGLHGIVCDRSGGAWFTENNDNRIGHLLPDGTIHRLKLKDHFAGPRGITSGPDGAVWFTEEHAIGRIDSSGALREFAIPPAAASLGTPHDIASGRDGFLWFAQGNAIGRISTGGEIVEYPIHSKVKQDLGITGIAAGRDGSIWFTESNADKIGTLQADKIPSRSKR